MDASTREGVAQRASSSLSPREAVVMVVRGVLIPDPILPTKWIVWMVQGAFLALTLTDVVDWPWIWVLAPAWIGAVAGGLLSRMPMERRYRTLLYLRALLIAAPLPLLKIMGVVDWAWWVALSPVWISMLFRSLFLTALVAGPRIGMAGPVGWVVEKGALGAMTVGAGLFATAVLAVLKSAGAVTWPWWVVLAPLGANLAILLTWLIIVLTVAIWMSWLMRKI